MGYRLVHLAIENHFSISSIQNLSFCNNHIPHIASKLLHGPQENSLKKLRNKLGTTTKFLEYISFNIAVRKG